MPFSDDVQKALIAGAFGLVGTVIPAAVSWSHDRSATSARNRTLEEATRRLAFWEQWIKLSIQVPLPGEPVTPQLQQELQMLREIVQKDSLFAHAQQMRLHSRSTAFQSRLGDLSLWRRLLLFYRPARPTAWFPRIFFYAGVFCALLIPFGLASPTDPLTSHDFVISEAVFLVWIVIFRSLSRWLEQPRRTPDAEIAIAPPPPPPKPL